jgi:CRP-like cAMP-binding protein
MKKYFPVLRSCPLFADIDEGALESMLQCLNAQSRRFLRGETVFHEGNEARWVGIVLEGAVQIFRNDYDGGRSLLGRAGVGQLFGEEQYKSESQYRKTPTSAAGLHPPA